MTLSTPHRRARLGLGRALALLALVGAAVAMSPVAAHAQGGKPGPDEMRWGLHVTLVSRWLDPAETEAFSTPFMVMYAIHDAMVQAFIWGVGPRVEEAGDGRIAGFSYSAPFDDLKLKKQ